MGGMQERAATAGNDAVNGVAFDGSRGLGRSDLQTKSCGVAGSCDRPGLAQHRLLRDEVLVVVQVTRQSQHQPNPGLARVLRRFHQRFLEDK